MSLPVPGRIAEALRRSTVQLPGGSGAVIGPELVITNAHVVRGGQPTVESWEGKRVSARISKLDGTRDLALLEAPGLNGLALTLADSDLLRPGAPVIAVGNPLGFVGALSSGVVHRIGTMRFRGAFARSNDTLAPAKDWICSDLHLAPGNSGGPLADFQGQLVGINTMIAAGGLAFAISSRAVQRFLQRTGPRAALGVTIRPVKLRDGRIALLILELAAGGAAESASLLQGDLLIAANGKHLEDPDDLLAAIEETAANGLLEIRFYRGRQDQVRSVTARLQAASIPHAA